MIKHLQRAVGAVVVLAVVALIKSPVPRAEADPTAAFFDDSVVQSIYLEINSKDWSTLKTNYLDNTYYPCTFKFNGTPVSIVVTPYVAPTV